MSLLTKRIGRFPLGIWIVLVLILTLGVYFTFVGQAVSLISWDTAVSWGMQEDSPQSADTMVRTMVAVSWGEAGADVLIQGSLIILTVIGILLRRRFGFITGIMLSAVWIYVTFLIIFQRVSLYRWGLAPDMSRVQDVWPVMVFFAGIPGMILLICLISNREYFTNGKEEGGTPR